MLSATPPPGPLADRTASSDAADLANLLRVVLYFDVFKHPVRVGEVQWMTGAAGREAIAAAVATGLVEEREGFIFRAGRSADVQRRRERAVYAERLWPAAMRAARILARVPFVRGVLLTGGLAKQSSEPGGDADFLLLVEPGCVWSTKSALQVARRALPESLRRLFCTNYLLSTDSLLLDDQDAFTAFELATALPLSGRVCADFVLANTWARQWIPGLDYAVTRAETAPAGARAPSALVPIARQVDTRLRMRWDTLWNQKYDWLDDDTRARRFKRSPDRATNHLHDFRAYVIDAYRERCVACGVDPLQGPVVAPRSDV